MKRLYLFASLLAVGLLLAAQVQAQDQAQKDAGQALRLPAEKSMLEISAETPKEVRIGEKFTYKIHAKNVSSNADLQQVTIHQDLPDGFKIDSSKPSPKTQQPGKTAEWTIPHLKPGETQTIEIQATANKEGAASPCLTASYTPALCLVLNVVKPQVSLLKAVPDKASVCEYLVFLYRIKNNGTGVSAPLAIRDQLPDGQQTEDGKHVVDFKVDPLKPGETKDFQTRIVATKAGDLRSQAQVFRQGDVETPQGKEPTPKQGAQPVAQSDQPTTKVQKPEIATTIDGLKAQNVGQPGNYTITVTNKGDAKARNARLTLNFDPSSVNLVSTGQPTRVTAGREEPMKDVNATGQGGTRTWNLGDLEPGQTVRVPVTLTGTKPNPLKFDATAGFDCLVAQKFIGTTSKATWETQVVALPALNVVITHRPDPATVGQEIDYDVAITNQGAADAKHVQLKVNLPGELEFVKGAGATQVTNEKGQAAVKPLDTLKPHDTASWKFTTRAKSAGQVLFGTQVSADFLKQPVTSQEPTVVVSPQGKPAPAKPQGK